MPNKIEFRKEHDQRRIPLASIDKMVAFGAAITLGMPSISSLSLPEDNSSTYTHVEWTINAQNKIKQATEANRLQRRLAYLIETYAEDEDAKPIAKEASANLKTFLSTLEYDYLLKGWNLFSNDCGALTLEYNKGNEASASICIAETQISYFVDKGKTTRITGIEPISASTIVNILSKVVG